ncbi:hypothetical protein LAUMK136_00786 [Mycobacterium attenuatum]|uniref:Uncharacterized protein n=1 Tax=Mycobacterium attenuatum TaxID=2341086 RepID=A0A498PU14_9MYCO|nr:hypothetical protein LAUMK136_00786 [Mycobacterium attenuatum]
MAIRQDISALFADPFEVAIAQAYSSLGKSGPTALERRDRRA